MRPKQPLKRIRRFVGLRVKALFHLSLLILALTSTFGALNYLYLQRQFDQELSTHFASIEQEMHGLLKRSADRLQRLGSVAAMLAGLSEPLPTEESGQMPESFTRLSALQYELDLQSLELINPQGRLLWR
ncbi:MAG: diguanylate cyclase, partial [Methylohalobius sp.]